MNTFKHVLQKISVRQQFFHIKSFRQNIWTTHKFINLEEFRKNVGLSVLKQIRTFKTPTIPFWWDLVIWAVFVFQETFFKFDKFDESYLKYSGVWLRTSGHERLKYGP